MSYKVVVADEIDARGLDVLAGIEGIDAVDASSDPGKLEAELPTAAGLIVRSQTTVTPQMLEVAQQLKVIGRAGIGVDNIAIPEASRLGIAVINVPGANTVSAAEHSIALLLALCRKIPWAFESMKCGEWNRKQFAGTELRGKTIGILGLGRVGSHVARIAISFGMHVLGYDPFLSDEQARALGVELGSLEDVLPRADILTLHMPLTNETRGLLNRETLALTRAGVLIVNTARGGLIDDTALLEGLESGQIGGAALDVFQDEPLARTSPLREAERVILTPHLGASTAEAQARVAVEIAKSVANALLSGNIGTAVNVPGVSAEIMKAAGPLLELARRAGRLAAAIAYGGVVRVELTHAGNDEEMWRAVTIALMEGVLDAVGISPITMVNAMAIAKERGIKVSRRVDSSQNGFGRSFTVNLRTTDREVSVKGSIVGEDTGRIVRIDRFSVDLVPGGHVIVLRNRDVPGVIGKVGTVLGEAGINIGSYHQARVESSHPEPRALAAIAVDHAPTPDVIRRLEAVADVMEVRYARLSQET